jgi:signal transduction histidine kinase
VVQAVSVLVANAIAYAPPGTEVLVRAEAAGNSWRLTVDDSGPGIPPADRERIFERFTRLDSSRSSTNGGSGLGLPICRRLLTLMGGKVEVSDSPTGGARFTISLPLSGKLNENSTHAQPEDNPNGR